MSALYEIDLVEWSERQAALLRRRAAGELINEADLDWPNIAEEIDAAGRSERSALASHIRVILEHLAKLEASPASEPRAGWRLTVLRARAAIGEVLEESPGLRPKLDTIIAREMVRVRPVVVEALARHGEMPGIAVDNISYGQDQVLGDWLP
jgi:hypothetical protein